MYEILRQAEIAACRAELAAAKTAHDRAQAQKLLEQARAETDRAAAYRQSCGRLVRTVHHVDGGAMGVVDIRESKPPASEETRGRLIIVPQDGTDVLMICMRIGDVYQWVSLTGTSVDVTDTQPILGTAVLGLMKLA